jgi:hypothetical protein
MTTTLETIKIGRVKYAVSYFDGLAKNEDGSDFFGIAIFKNKVKLNRFIQDLKKQDYKCK